MEICACKKAISSFKNHKRDQMNGLNFFVRLNNISSLIIILILSRIIIKQKRLIAKKKMEKASFSDQMS
jgi:hypothetical protein